MRTPERRNSGQVGCLAWKDDGQDGLPARENGGCKEVFEERLKRMDITDLEDDWEKLEAVAKEKDVPRKEAMVNSIRELYDWY
jgi:hypothetical protein